jgi:hypothetical protein
MMKQTASIVLSGLILLSLMGCATNAEDPTNFESAPLYGMVYDYQNRPVKSVEISWNDSVIAESDINGRFFLSDLPRGEHTLSFSKDGYEHLTLEIQFQNRTEALYLKMRSAFDCLTEANTLISQNAYYEGSVMIEIGLSIDPENEGLLFLNAILNYKIGDFDASLARIRSLLENASRKDDVIYQLLVDITAASPDHTMTVSDLILAYPPPPQSRAIINTLQETTGYNGNE